MCVYVAAAVATATNAIVSDEDKRADVRERAISVYDKRLDMYTDLTAHHEGKRWEREKS